MTTVSVTRLHVRSKRFLLPFLIYTWRSGRQLKRSAGFRGGVLGKDAQGANWTMTLWDSEAAMRSYRNAGIHAIAMRKLLDWCDEASFVHYTTDDSAVPSVEEAYQRLTSGKISKVNYPSAAHAAGRTVSAGLPRFALNLRRRS